MMTIKNWNIEQMTGYQPKTTFYTDFSIADHFGKDAIVDTYERAFKHWKNNVEYVTELAMALNWKSWEHSNDNPNIARLYVDLWRKVDKWCMDNLKGDDIQYYLRTTD